MDMREYVAERGITLTVLADHGVKRTDDDGRTWEHHAYTVHLSYPATGGVIDTPWRQGLGVMDGPDAASVLDSLVSDAWGADNARGYEDFAGEYGYDEDSRKGEAIYRACLDVRDRLVPFLGGREAFEHLATEVDRL